MAEYLEQVHLLEHRELAVSTCLSTSTPSFFFVWQVTSPQNKSRTLHDDWKDANPHSAGKKHGYA